MSETEGVRRDLLAQLDTWFLGVLALSLAVHFLGAGYLATQPLPPEAEGRLEDLPLDRFVRQEFTLHIPAPKRLAAAPTPANARPTRGSATAAPAAVPASAGLAAKVEKAGLLAVIGSGAGGTEGLRDLLGASSSEVAAALDGAAQRLGEGALASAGPARRGADVGARADGVQLATDGARQVQLAERAPQVVATLVETDVDVETPDVDVGALAAWLARHKGGLQGCYERELKAAPSLQGRLVLRFELTPRGRVAELSFGADSTLQSDSLRRCVATVAHGWVLPFTPEADTAVSFPFVFAPAGS